MIPRKRSFAVAAFAFALALPALAEEAPEKYMELLRSDLRTEKVQILTEALHLNESQAAAFWPIYREYETELSALGDRRITLIKQFVDAWGSISDEAAGTFASDAFDIQKDRLKLRQKYFGKVAKATSNKIAARFIQVENTLGELVDLQIAAELPLLE